jgi:hypothetical protein
MSIEKIVTKYSLTPIKNVKKVNPSRFWKVLNLKMYSLIQNLNG